MAYVCACADVRVENWPLVYNPWLVVGIILGYILLCILGPKLMASRRPFELKPVLVVYNAAMVALSFHIAKEVLYPLLSCGNFKCNILFCFLALLVVVVVVVVIVVVIIIVIVVVWCVASDVCAGIEVQFYL